MSPPTDIELQTNASIRGVTRTQSENTLMISGLTIPLMWTPPDDLDVAEINGYDVIVSLSGTDLRYTDPTSDFVSTNVRIARLNC